MRFEVDRIQIVDRKQTPLPELGVGDWVWVMVSDTGVGIPAGVLPHIFEPFFTTKAPGKGTGLGLAQVHGIVSAHEGVIDVHSQPGQGARFAIYLPALATQAAQPQAIHEQALPHGDGETILVVEDDATVRGALKEALASLDYGILEADSGKQALAVLSQRAGQIVHWDVTE